MRDKMKASQLAACYAICALLLLLLPLYLVEGQNYATYSIQINSDGSALWKITIFSDINASVDSFSDFQNKISNLVISASSVTQRTMMIDENSLQINTTILSPSKITEYSFLWQNFSEIQGKEIFFGDVFQVKGFFTQLYGDDALQISYPSSFNVKTIIPTPYQRDDLDKTLDWARTQDLVSGKTEIILTSSSSNNNPNHLYTIVVPVAVVGSISSVFVFYIFKLRKKLSTTTLVDSMETVGLETEEGKILKLLKSAGGTMHQSDIVNQCRFSKAKTSQLLTILEKNGNITRHKKGRDKIVNLAKQAKSD
jgi:uncharacterized membrane protein